MRGKGKDWEVRNWDSMREAQEKAKETDRGGTGWGYEGGRKGIGKIVVGIATGIAIVGVAGRHKRVRMEIREDKGCREEPKHSWTGSGLRS